MNSIHQAYNSNEICIKFSHSHFWAAGHGIVYIKTTEYSISKCFVNFAEKLSKLFFNHSNWIHNPIEVQFI